SCHTRLKKVCIQCHRLLELSWNICPHCATSQVAQDNAEWYTTSQQPAPTSHTELRTEPRSRVRRRTESLEFVDGDEF
ncbi:MAG: hypothetical protein K8J31_28335, partial [Anaerolineae bacterium]|nr:hypothetical protein [Anaerolineae bacterium]